MGSGTTALAALELNRHYIGFEMNQDYVDIANTLIDEKNCEI
jgi:site-specific DNA-methyltransferase (adenine-specific)